MKPERTDDARLRDILNISNSTDVSSGLFFLLRVHRPIPRARRVSLYLIFCVFSICFVLLQYFSAEHVFSAAAQNKHYFFFLLSTRIHKVWALEQRYVGHCVVIRFVLLPERTLHSLPLWPLKLLKTF